MKKNFFPLCLAMCFVLSAFLIQSCKTDDDDDNNNTPDADVTPPVITINNNTDTYNWVTQFSTTVYSDQGATATDAHDGAITVTVTGTVNMNQAGAYTLTYSATDAAGNHATATRTVNVDGAKYVAGSYTVEDFTGAVSNGSYPESLTASVTTPDSLHFSKFAFYVNAAVDATVQGTTITVPSQTVVCGNPAASRTFSGSGTFTNGFTSFTINYTETTGGSTVNGHGVYTKN